MYAYKTFLNIPELLPNKLSIILGKEYEKRKTTCLAIPHSLRGDLFVLLFSSQSTASPTRRRLLVYTRNRKVTEAEEKVSFLIGEAF